jgi:hypothetical protein
MRSAINYARRCEFMSATIMFSRGTLIVSIIIIFGILVAILIGNLPVEIRNIIWYLLVIMVIVAAIAWAAHHKAKDAVQEEMLKEKGTRYTPEGGKPQIGHTYKYSDDEEKET